MRFGFCDSPRFRLVPRSARVNGAPVAKNGRAGELPSADHALLIRRAPSRRTCWPRPTGTCQEKIAVTTWPRSQSERPRSAAGC